MLTYKNYKKLLFNSYFNLLFNFISFKLIINIIIYYFRFELWSFHNSFFCFDRVLNYMKIYYKEILYEKAKRRIIY